MGARTRVAGAAVVGATAVAVALSQAASAQGVPDADRAQMGQVVQAFLNERNTHVARPGPGNVLPGGEEELLSRATPALLHAEADVNRRLDEDRAELTREGVVYTSGRTTGEVTEARRHGSGATVVVTVRSEYQALRGPSTGEAGDEWRAGFVRRGSTWLLDTLDPIHQGHADGSLHEPILRGADHHSAADHHSG